MSASDKPPSRPAPPSPSHDAEQEAVERIAGMSDDELASHLADGGVDVAALDAQVDSIREQIVASGIGAPSQRSARARYGGGGDGEDARPAYRQLGPLGKV